MNIEYSGSEEEFYELAWQACTGDGPGPARLRDGGGTLRGPAGSACARNGYETRRDAGSKRTGFIRAADRICARRASRAGFPLGRDRDSQSGRPSLIALPATGAGARRAYRNGDRAFLSCLPWPHHWHYRHTRQNYYDHAHLRDPARQRRPYRAGRQRGWSGNALAAAPDYGGDAGSAGIVELAAWGPGPAPHQPAGCRDDQRLSRSPQYLQRHGGVRGGEGQHLPPSILQRPGNLQLRQSVDAALRRGGAWPHLVYQPGTRR